jgi:hypothetical protein
MDEETLILRRNHRADVLGRRIITELQDWVNPPFPDTRGADELVEDLVRMIDKAELDTLHPTKA